MLIPAVLYKEQIIKKFQKRYYTEDMMFETGGTRQWCPEILDIPTDGMFQYAIVSKNKLIGYLSYQVNYYASTVYNFCLLSFDKGNPVIGEDVFAKIKSLVSTFHRVEWRMVGGNPAERSYDRFCKRHHGTKHILKDAVRDANGIYHDDIIYEIVKEKYEQE